MAGMAAVHRGGLWSDLGDLARWVAFQLGACAAGPAQGPGTDPATKAAAHACQPLLGL